jgi:MSHA biogenesis protein MshO
MMREHGFTLLELIIVIVITAIIGTAISVFFQPAIMSYVDAKRRTNLSDLADTTLRRMSRDIRAAVPNSIRSPNSQCFELVPTTTGGRYRKLADTGGGSAPLDTSRPLGSNGNPGSFDILSTMSHTPSIGDWVVIDNQNVNDVHTNPTLIGNIYYGNRAKIGAVNTTPSAGLYRARITLDSSYTNGANTGFQFPAGYDDGRFTVVADNGGKPVVAYVCVAADGTLNASGNGKGTVYRITQAFSAAYPSACPDINAPGISKALVATQVVSCNFIYDPNQGATQQSGFVWLQMTLAENNERSSLSFGIHVDNLP